MGKLITVIGNSGVGKTTFTRQLSQRLPLIHALEEHAERPFQEGFAFDFKRLALHNQVDYLVFRAEQELEIRKGSGTGIQDGGLDVDFWVFTRLFHRKGYLTGPEFRLCERVFILARDLLPPPDLVIYLTAPLEVIQERFARRSRSLEIAQLPDLVEIESLLQDWLSRIDPSTRLTVDVSVDDPGYGQILPPLVSELETILK